MLVLFFQSIPFILALGLGMLLPLLLMVQYDVSSKATPDTRVIVAILLIAGGTILTIVLTPRVLNENLLATGAGLTYSDYGDTFWASRLLNLFLVGAGAAELLRGWLNSRHKNHLPDPARPILHALMVFYFGTALIHLAGSEYPDFSYKDFYSPVLLMALYFQRVTNMQRILEVVKMAILACTAGSLVAMVVAPDSVLHRPEPGFIPGIDFRLFGLAPHANALGPIALLGIVLELHSSSRQRWLHWLHLLAAIAVFILAQSKTVWVAAFVLIVIVYVPLMLAPSVGSATRSGARDRALKAALICVTALVLITSVASVFDASAYLEKHSELSSFSGRNLIWDVTLDEWQKNILFGYGSGLWGVEFRVRHGMLAAGQAHDQFLQTLGDAGLVGLLCLLTYLGIYLTSAIRCFTASRGIVLTVLVMMLIQFITEAPLGGAGILSWYTFEQSVFILLVCHYLRQNAEAQMASRTADVFKYQEV